jgi:hypothetical protein
MSFEMYTKAGNTACQAQLNKIVKFIKTGKGITPEVINTMYVEAMKKIAVKHREVYDTEPEWHLKDRIKKALQENYYDKTKFF